MKKEIIMGSGYKWKGKTVLVVDDEYINYLLFEAILEDTELRLIHAMNGEKAVQECLNNKEIDLVLMDIKMPVCDGYEAARKIKENRKDLPVIAQTAYTASEDYYKCISSGFDEYIPKPIERELLLYKISTFFN